jgi:hypothetical protein
VQQVIALGRAAGRRGDSIVSCLHSDMPEADAQNSVGRGAWEWCPAERLGDAYQKQVGHTYIRHYILIVFITIFSGRLYRYDPPYHPYSPGKRGCRHKVPIGSTVKSQPKPPPLRPPHGGRLVRVGTDHLPSTSLIQSTNL